MKRWCLLLCLAALCLLGLGFALGSAPLLRVLAPLQFEGLQGSLWTRLQARELSGTSAGLRWKAQGLDWRWQGVRDGALHGQLTLQTLELEPAPQGAAPTPLSPEQVLAALRWPLGLRLAPLRIERLSVAGHMLGPLQLNLAVADGAHALRISQLSLQSPDATLHGEATLQANGVLHSQWQAQRGAARLSASARGSLAHLPLELRLTGTPAMLAARADLAPLAAQPLRALHATFSRLNPQALHPKAPVGAWSGSVSVQGAGGALVLNAQADNADALRLDQQGWPLRRLQLRLRVNPAQWQQAQLEQLDLHLGGAQSAGRLVLQPQTGVPRTGQPWHTRVALQELRPERLHRRWPAMALRGELRLSQARWAAPGEPLLATLSLQGGAFTLGAQAELVGRALRQLHAQLDQGSARITVAGEAQWSGPSAWQLALDAQARRWPLNLGPWPQPSVLDGQAQGRWAQAPHSAQGELHVQLGPESRLAALPVQGHAHWRSAAQASAQANTQAGAPAGAWQLRLNTGTDHLLVSGQQAHAPRQLADLARLDAWRPSAVQWQLADLSRLHALWRPWLAQAQGHSSGQWHEGGARPLLRVQAEQLVVQALGQPALHVQQLQARLEAQDAALTLRGAQVQGWRIEHATGTLRAGALHMQAQGRSPALPGQREPTDWQLDLAARDAGGGTWQQPTLSLGPPDAQAPRWLHMSGSPVQWQGGQLRWDRADLRFLGQALQLRQMQIDPLATTLQLQLDGRAALAPWLDAIDPRVRWRGDASAQLSLALRWAAGQPSYHLRLDDLRGDLLLDGEALHLHQLALQAQREAGARMDLRLHLDSPGLAQVQAHVQSAAQGGALQGHLSATLPRLQALQAWWPALALDGQAKLEARLSGTLGAPRLNGEAQVNLAHLQHPASGLAAQQVQVHALFDEDRLRIRELKLEGQGESGGQLRGEGELRWGPAWQGRLSMQASQLRVLNRFDRQLTLSGHSEWGLQGKTLRVRGELHADQGVFDLGQLDRPQLDEDVSVLAREIAEQRTQSRALGWPRDIDLRIDLGQRLRLQGRGFASRLTGQLRVQEQGGKPAHWSGRIQTQGGRYKAYGQTLDLETGELRFNGALDNPRLELLAIKPDVEHRVGVSVSGSTQAPRARLFSEPPLPDNDVLAWLLLGRDPADLASRDTALLQRAALALLSGEGDNPASQLMDRLGLKELSISPDDDAGTVLRVGAALGKHWTLGYERSLNATSGSWQLIYRLGQGFRLRAQSGTDSALDLLWLWRFD